MKSIACAVFLAVLASGKMSAQTVKSEVWGQTADGEDVQLFTLTNQAGLKARVMSFGATLVGVDAPDRDGRFENVTLHFDDFETFNAQRKVFGSTIGRFANRIDTGGFEIDGKRYDLETFNERTKVHIHGGATGFQWQNWRSEPVEHGVRFSLTSPDGHEGFPGKLEVSVTYELTNDNELFLRYEATTDKPTHVNLTNHAYWNLGGAGSGDVLGQQLLVDAEQILEVDDRQVPTGKLVPVAGTPFDFREPHAIGGRIDQIEGGYDHCYVLKPGGELQLAARVVDPKSGRVMEVRTTEPGVQVYTMNIGKPITGGGGGASYGPRNAVCLECQHFPDTPNKPEFPGALIKPGDVYLQVTTHKFSTTNE